MRGSFNRRRLLIGGAAALTSSIALPVFVPRTVFAQGNRPGANDRVVVGAIGCGFRARLLMDQLPEAAQLVAIADCNIEQAFKFRQERNAKWDIYSGHYRIVDRKDIDAVVMTGQEFQRALPCIHAVQSGKDVYAEKPLTLYIQEGRTMIGHVRKHQAVFQVGTQQRSMEVNRIACEFVRNGGLGKLTKVQAVNYPGVDVTPEIDSDGLGNIPPGFNWDLHLNQSVWRPCVPNAIAGRNYVGGEMTNWGATEWTKSNGHSAKMTRCRRNSSFLAQEETGRLLPHTPMGRRSFSSFRLPVRWVERSSSVKRGNWRSTGTRSCPTPSTFERHFSRKSMRPKKK